MPAIPFDIPSPQIPFVVMHGEAGSTPLRVLFDSGNAAPFTLLLSEAKGPQLATPTGEPPQVTGAVVGGSPASLTPAILPTFRLGPIKLRQVRVALSPSVDIVGRLLPGGLDAVVGYEFAAHHVVAIDYDAKAIDFDAKPGRGSAAPMSVTPKKHLTVVPVTINGKGPFRMALDTGAGGTLLSPQAAAAAGVASTGPQVRLAGAGGTGTPAHMEAADLALGAHRWTAARIFVADLMGPISAEAGAPVDGVLGAPLFAHGRLILDYPGRRVWMGDAPRTKP